MSAIKATGVASMRHRDHRSSRKSSSGDGLAGNPNGASADPGSAAGGKPKGASGEPGSAAGGKANGDSCDPSGSEEGDFGADSELFDGEEANNFPDGLGADSSGGLGEVISIIDNRHYNYCLVKKVKKN